MNKDLALTSSFSNTVSSNMALESDYRETWLYIMF